MTLRLSAFVSINLILVFHGIALTQTTAEDLIRDLACFSCHTGIAFGSDIREKTPDLAQAGLRHNPAYLFEYLQKPVRVRPNIGHSRMPDFHLGPKESLALTLYLTAQKTILGDEPKWPDELQSSTTDDQKKLNRSQAIDLLDARLGCIKCHQLDNKGSNLSVDLGTIGLRLNRDWLAKYLAAPQIYDGPATTMPGLFYSLATEGDLIQTYPGGAKVISDIVHYLFSLNEERRAELDEAYEEAKAANPEIDEKMGERIFLSQNCMACHRNHLATAWREHNAPDLGYEGGRVKGDWLLSFLRKPVAVRPFGYYPGSGSRMPDFSLTDEEAGILTDFLMTQKQEEIIGSGIYKVERISRFSMKKAEKLLEDKLPCLGCHQLGDTGGRIGPNLSKLKDRLQPDYVHGIISDPQRILPETIMPKHAMPQKTLQLIANFLLQKEPSKSKTEYLSLIENQPMSTNVEGKGSGIYLKFCASCHGLDGRASGYNAKYLPAPPTTFTDDKYISTRPDDTLFDGIFAGGYILNKSNRMPAWGYTLQVQDIRELVEHIRDLCNCQGPDWSLDNK